MQTNYLDWAIRQKEFSDKLKGSRSVVLSHWGDYSYNVSIPGYDGEGRKHIFRFQVEQLFWLTCKLPCEPYPKILLSLNMKNDRSLTPRS